jgi:hypothetical protein
MPRRRDRDAVRVVYRTARVGLRLSRGQRRRCFGLLAAAGEVWACVLEVNWWRWRRRAAPLVSYRELCRELAAAGKAGPARLAALAQDLPPGQAHRGPASPAGAAGPARGRQSRRDLGRRAAVRHPHRRRPANRADRRSRAAAQPAAAAMATRSGHRHPHRQGRTGRDHRPPGRRTWHLVDLPPLHQEDPQTTRAHVDLPTLHPHRAPRPTRGRHHRHPPPGRRPTSDSHPPTPALPPALPQVITHRRAGRHLPGAGRSRRDPRRPAIPGRAGQLASGGPPHHPVGSRSPAPRGEDPQHPASNR